MKKFTKIMTVMLCSLLALTGCESQPKTAKVDGLSFTIPGYYTESANSSVEEASSTLDVKQSTSYNVPDEEDGTIELGFSKTNLKADASNTGGTMIKFLMGLLGYSTSKVKEQSEKEINGYTVYFYNIVNNDTNMSLAWFSNKDSGCYDLISLVREPKEDKWPQKHDYEKDFDAILESVSAQ